MSPKGSAGALCRPQRSEGDQHTPTSSTNAPPPPLSRQQDSKDFHAVGVTSCVLIARMWALSCDDEASDDELRPNSTSSSQWALHSSLLPKFPCPQYVIGEERRGVWRRTRVTVVGSVLLEASWNKEKQSASELFHSRFYGPLIAVNAGRTGRSWTGGGIFYFYFHVKLRDTVKDLKLSVFCFFCFFYRKSTFCLLRWQLKVPWQLWFWTFQDYFSSTPLKNKEYRGLEYCKSSILFPWSVLYKFLNTLKAFLKSLCASGYKINKSKHRILIKYVQISRPRCTNEGYINKLAEYSGNNLGINDGSFKF